MADGADPGPTAGRPARRTIARIAGPAGLALLLPGCGSSQAPKPSGELTRAEAEAVAGARSRPLKDLGPGPTDAEAEARLRRAVVGRWVLRDVPPFHYKMLDGGAIARVDAAYPDPYLDLNADGTYRGTAIAARGAGDPDAPLAVFGRDEHGTWDVAGTRLRTTARKSNHTSTVVEEVEVRGDTMSLTFTHFGPETFPPKVFVRRRADAPAGSHE